MRILVGVLVAAITFPAYAETLYVTEKLPVTLRAASAEGSPAVKVVEGGAPLEVLERADRSARVRDAQGAEGWIEARWLTNAAPARSQLERAQADSAKVRKELDEAQARIKQLETTLSQQGALIKTAAQEKPVAPATASSGSSDDEDFPWGWLVLAFAMLWLGFGAGVVWVRERHRKKLGGMYLRI